MAVESLHNSRCLVTGGAGFIGRYLVAELLNRGSSVTVFDRTAAEAGAFGEARDVRFVQAELGDDEKLSRALRGHDVVFHLAARTDTSPRALSADADVQAGPVATGRLLDAMRANRIRNLVFASSQLVYGRDGEQMRAEDTAPLLPDSFYGAAKLCCEALISAHAHLFGIRALILRLCNITGERLERGILYDFVSRLLRSPARLEVRGEEGQERHFLRVEECVEGILHACSHRVGKPVEVYNVASLNALKLSAVAETVLEEMGLLGLTQVTYTGSGNSREAPSRLLLDTRKLRRLGWTPRLSSEACIRETVRGLRSRITRPGHAGCDSSS